MPITVAITSYNAKDHLGRLLPQLREQGFSDIVVLDDASTDGSQAWLRDQSNIRTVLGKTNLGPTGNRNRILELETASHVLFIDVDMELVSDDIAAALASEFKSQPNAAVVAPLILSETNEPMWYNWGYEFSPKLDGLNEALNAVALAHWHDPAVMATVRRLAQGKVGHFEPVESRNADWVAEPFFAVRMDVFRALGGFDPQFRMFHEGPDYCLRARQLGHTVRFTTAITVKHLDLHSGNDEQRTADLRNSTKYYYQKHYGVSDAVAERFFLW